MSYNYKRNCLHYATIELFQNTADHPSQLPDSWTNEALWALQVRFPIQHFIWTEETHIHHIDFLPRQPFISSTKPLLSWLIRRVEVIRGNIPIRVECAPAFDYARATHTTEIVVDESVMPKQGAAESEWQKKVCFESEGLDLDLRFVAESTMVSSFFAFFSSIVNIHIHCPGQRTHPNSDSRSPRSLP